MTIQSDAEEQATTFQTNFNNDIADVEFEIHTYNGLKINYDHIVELYKQYLDENKELSQQLKDDTSDVLTNDRKTFYEDQGITNLNYYYYILIVIYVIIVICFVIFSFIYPSQSSWKMKLGMLIGFIILPFFSTNILGYIIEFIYKIYDLLPTNIHRII